MPNNYSRYTLNVRERENLLILFCKLYSISDPSNIIMSAIRMKYSHISMYGKQLGSFKTRTASSSVVMAEWNTCLLGPCSLADETSTNVVNRAARINYFCKHTITIHGQSKTHVLVNLSWFLYHPKYADLGKPITLWYDSLFDPNGIHTLIPVQYIKKRTVSIVEKLNDHDSLSVIIVIPCINF